MKPSDGIANATISDKRMLSRLYPVGALWLLFYWGHGLTDSFSEQPKFEFIDARIELFEKLKKQYDEEMAKKERKPINVALKDGSVKVVTAWETSSRHCQRY